MSAFVSRCRLSISSTSFIPHSLHNLSSLGTPFYLPVSICKGADPPLNISSILVWVFSCTFQHLPLRPSTCTEFKTQSLSLLQWSSVQSFSKPQHAILLNVSLSCLPETPARVAHAAAVLPTKGLQTNPNFPFHWLLLGAMRAA